MVRWWEGDVPASAEEKKRTKQRQTRNSNPILEYFTELWTTGRCLMGGGSGLCTPIRDKCSIKAAEPDSAGPRGRPGMVGIVLTSKRILRMPQGWGLPAAETPRSPPCACWRPICVWRPGRLADGKWRRLKYWITAYALQQIYLRRRSAKSQEAAQLVRFFKSPRL